MTISEQISAAFKDGKTLVFPSETSARSQLYAFLKQNPNKAILTEKSLSWDTYKKSQTIFPKDKKASDTVNRFLFAYSFFQSEDFKKLRFFNAFEFVSEVANLLPKLKQMLEMKDLNANLVHDVRILYAAYQLFMDKNNLYEEDYFEPVYNYENTVFVFPEAYSDKDASLIKGETITSTDVTLPDIKVFPNSLAEIRDCIRTVFNLLDTENPNDISITVTDAGSYIPFLVSEADKRSIKLAVMKGKMLSEYPAGRMFGAIKQIYEEDFSISSIKNFLLDPAYPFANKDAILNFIRLSLLCNVEIGGKDCFILKDRLRKCSEEGSAEALNFIIKFTEFVKGICTSKDAETLRKAIKSFQDYFFMDGSWDSSESEINRSVFQRCFSTLEEIEKTNIAITDIYSAFCAVISNINYVPQNTEGIKVYEYPLSCALNVKYHFLLGLDDSSSRVEICKNLFAGRLSGSLENQIGDNIIRSYCYDPNLSVSCSVESFTNTCIIPSVFSELGKINEINQIQEDSFSAEEELWKTIKTSTRSIQNQKNAYDRALKTSYLTGTKINIPSAEKPYKISATKLQAFDKCPYRWMCQYLLELKEIQFDPQTVENLELGNLLHKTYEEWFEKVHSFEQAVKEESKQLLINIFDRNFKEYSKQYYVPSPLYIKKLENKYRESLFSITDDKDKVLENTEFYEKEKHFCVDYKGHVLSGDIDAIFTTPEGKFVIIDFKTGTIDKNSPQIALYAKILKTPVRGAYYSIKNKKFKIVFQNDVELAQVIESCSSLLDKYIETLDSNVLEATPSDENCSNCLYSRICRKRYVIK